MDGIQYELRQGKHKRPRPFSIVFQSLGACIFSGPVLERLLLFSQVFKGNYADQVFKSGAPGGLHIRGLWVKMKDDSSCKVIPTSACLEALPVQICVCLTEPVNVCTLSRFRVAVTANGHGDCEWQDVGDELRPGCDSAGVPDQRVNAGAVRRHVYVP